MALLGPARSGKTYDLATRYRQVLETGSPTALERALWLAPNGRTAAAVRDQLVRTGLTACLHTGVLTFEDLTDQVLAVSNARLKTVDALLRRDLIRRVITTALENQTLRFYAGAARRPGFVGLVAEHITELQRRNISPKGYADRLARDRQSAEQTELAQLYTAYESLFVKHNLVDRNGAHRAACTALSEGACHRFRDLELVVADGFTDFTSTQHEILRLLSQRAKQLFISLPSDTQHRSEQSSRPELFAKTAASLQELQQHFPKLEIKHARPRPLPNAAIEHFAQHLFAHPNQLPPLPASAIESLLQIEIVEAASTQDEIIQLARRIKALLTKSPRPVSPGDILVVCRSLTAVAARFHEVFTNFGIPYYLDDTRSLITAPAIKTITDLLQLNEDDWPFRRVISILTNNSLSAFTNDSRIAADWLVRDLQIATGQTTLVDRVQSLAGDAAAAGQRSEHLEQRTKAATAALPALALLAGALKELPNQATPTDWCAALARFAATLGLTPFVGDPDKANDSAGPDHAAWKIILAHCQALERLDGWLGQPPRKLSRSDFQQFLRDFTSSAALPHTHNESGRVRVLTATAARNISARHLFLAGMTEQAFPSPESAGRLATDADYHRLTESPKKSSRSASPPIASRAQAEMLLFYEMITRAEESLTISFPALDDKAQSLPPSPYVVELERLATIGEHRQIKRTTPQLSPIAAGQTPYSIIDWRIQAVARAVDTDNANRSLLAGIFSSPVVKPLAASIDSGLRIVYARARGQTFGPAEGLLTSPAIADRLAHRFGKKHTWSASQWETYATCPFRFFMQHVLKLEPLGDLVLETDFARRGSRLHDVLAKFHRDWLILRKNQPASTLAGGTDDEATAFLAHLQQVANDRNIPASRVGVDAALLELDRRQILKWSNHHFDHQSKYEGACGKLGPQMTPTHFEFRFGPDRRLDSLADPDSTTNTFTINIEGEPVQITGQIDRIDVAEVNGKTVFNVIDYKSGRRASVKREQLETGQQLQLPIYVEAAQALVFEGKATPLQAGYWSMGAGYDAKGALTDKINDEKPTGGWQDTQTIVHGLIHEFIQNIRHGDFPVDSRDDKCTSTCDYHMTCRVTQARSLGKSQAPAGTTTQLNS